MRKRIMICLVAVLSMGAIAELAAQKLGHLNVQEIMSILPERKGLEEQVQTFAKELEKTYALMTTEYQNKITEFQQLAPGGPQSVKDMKIQDLQQLEQRIKEFEMKAQEDLAAKEEELLEPLITKVQGSIKKVAEANNFIYIFDSSVGVLLHAGGQDVAPLIKKDLGLQ